ncbi:double-stranded RNA-binding protein Staufen homolog [Artemia franciscana]|uniref:DRBM domain-containing protein n=1 Tax=Artemia franciscana TaxID=6661 RepID=A0AA88HA56_ARTSF|nr:hypothetical protein QYM36_013972 [Artemia franciscana]
MLIEDTTEIFIDKSFTEMTQSNIKNTILRLNGQALRLLNDIATINKIQHQYRLVKESGQGHKKMFFVELELGDETYKAYGSSIKKARHAAAAEALFHTRYPRLPTKKMNSVSSRVKPTAELNVLAMKIGVPVTYNFVERPLPLMPGSYMGGGYNYHKGPFYQNRRVYNPRRYSPCGYSLSPHVHRFPDSFTVTCKILDREYEGTAPTPQAAKHNAAQKALNELKNMPSLVENKQIEKHDDPSLELKSPISLVYELAFTHNLNIRFDVISESGPPHRKNFVTKCTVDDLTTEGEGRSKSLSKNRSAKLMLEELKKILQFK